MWYYLGFAVVFVCFLYHTFFHVLGYYKKIKPRKLLFNLVGVCMFLGWFSYFYISFYQFPETFSLTNYIGIIFLLIGIFLFVVSHGKIHKRMHLGKGGFVKEGVYKYLRHPMYAGEILMILGAPILGSSLLTFGLSPIFIIQILIWRHLEEKKLIREFPEYKEYKKRTWF